MSALLRKPVGLLPADTQYRLEVVGAKQRRAKQQMSILAPGVFRESVFWEVDLALQGIAGIPKHERGAETPSLNLGGGGPNGQRPSQPFQDFVDALAAEMDVGGNEAVGVVFP